VSKGLMDHEILRPSLAEDDEMVAALLPGSCSASVVPTFIGWYNPVSNRNVV
jgi:hypothetical protein